MREKTGGAAFPTPRFMVDDESRILGFSINTDGMSMRDYFAAQAMQGFLADGAAPDVSKEAVASMAYAMADAMLEERNK
tara:strand:+ start:174 stop:410 length:237 start_codon:yes stop_codon:yes gene_type:complete